MSKPMKVKVKYVQGHLYIVIFEIYRGCPAAIPIFDNLISSWDIWKRIENPAFSGNRTQARFFSFFEQTTTPILMKFSGKIEFVDRNKKSPSVAWYF